MSSQPPLPPPADPPAPSPTQIDQRIPAAHRMAFLAGLAVLAILMLMTDFMPVLDHFNLAIHESGHLFFAILGSTASLYGGTLMQFVFPIAVTWHFLRLGQRLSAAVGVVWGLQNLQYVALYLGDARARELPLVGGGEHDWYNILGRWGLLAWDTRLATLLELVSWIGLAAVAWWAWRLGRPPRRRMPARRMPGARRR